MKTHPVTIEIKISKYSQMKTHPLTIKIKISKCSECSK